MSMMMMMMMMTMMNDRLELVRTTRVYGMYAEFVNSMLVRYKYNTWNRVAI